MDNAGESPVSLSLNGSLAKFVWYVKPVETAKSEMVSILRKKNNDIKIVEHNKKQINMLHFIQDSNQESYEKSGKRSLRYYILYF